MTRLDHNVGSRNSKEKSGAALGQVKKVIIWAIIRPLSTPDLHHAPSAANRAVGGGAELVQGQLHPHGCSSAAAAVIKAARHFIRRFAAAAAAGSRARLDARHAGGRLGELVCRPTAATEFPKASFIRIRLPARTATYSIVQDWSSRFQPR